MWYNIKNKEADVEDIFWFSVLFCAIQLFALPAFKGLDYNKKQTNKKLILLGRKKYFFIKYKENPKFISQSSFIFQLIHYLICFLLIILSIVYLFFNNNILFYVTISIYFSYIAFAFILLIYVAIVSLFIDEKNEKSKKK